MYAEPDAEREVVELAVAAGIEVRDVAPGALAKVTSPVTPQAVAAIATTPAPASVASLSGFVLVLVEIADPGNAGTLIRSAEAAGAAGIVCCGQVVDVWNPKCVRASAGSVFRVPVAADPDIDGVLDELRARGVRVLAAHGAGAGRAGVRYTDADLTGDVAVLLGNEAHGLPDEVLEAVDEIVSVPMTGEIESLNVAMTGTVIAFEAARQRARMGAGDGR